MLVNSALIILFLVILLAVHLYYKNEIVFIKSEAKKAIQDVAIDSFCWGADTGRDEERRDQTHYLDKLLDTHSNY